MFGRFRSVHLVRICGLFFQSDTVKSEPKETSRRLLEKVYDDTTSQSNLLDRSVVILFMGLPSEPLNSSEIVTLTRNSSSRRVIRTSGWTRPVETLFLSNRRGSKVGLLGQHLRMNFSERSPNLPETLRISRP